MTEPSRESDRTDQMSSLYQALGRFVVQFSRMVYAMEMTLLLIGDGHQLIGVLTTELTADPLARAWRSAMIQATDLSGDDLEVLAGLATEITALINLRNDWSHGTWLVGYGDPEADWSRAVLKRFKNSAKGLAPPSKLERKPAAAYIEKAATHAALVEVAIYLFGITVFLRRQGETDARPSDRVRIVKKDGHRQVHVTEDDSNWRFSEWMR